MTSKKERMEYQSMFNNNYGKICMHDLINQGISKYWLYFKIFSKYLIVSLQIFF
jgi:hypothetical protein